MTTRTFTLERLSKWSNDIVEGGVLESDAACVVSESLLNHQVPFLLD